MARILLIHLSDLHIGSHHVGTDLSTGIGAWWPFSNWAAGVSGHAFTLLKALRNGIHDALARLGSTADDTVEWLVGGDLTRIGGHFDFHIAYTYLLSELTWLSDRAGTPRQIGLNIGQAPLHCVSGNHDHWDGQTPGQHGRPPAYNPGIIPDYFEQTPWRHTILTKNKDLGIELFGVDSNSGLHGYATNIRARGALSANELAQLDTMLQQARGQNVSYPRVAALLCHHAFRTRDVPPFHTRPLAPQSRTQLQAILHKHNVRAALTGHTHYFSERKWKSGWELRCGTTLQMPSKLSFPAPQHQQLLAPGFYIHEVLPGTGSGWNAPEWHAWKYQWDGQKFRPAPNPTHVT